MRDLHNNIAVRRGLSPVAAGTDNTAYVSEIVDTQGFGSCEFIILIGANTDADVTFSVLFEDGDAANLSDHAAVADEYLLGTEAAASFDYSDDNEVRKIGYAGPKRYCRVTITPAGNNSGNIFIAGAWVLGHPATAPVA
ncbi:hypothetical protein J2848_000360 [Azospirillum lipoferum]|uniref:PLAT domain-containing protein n=1 Tax=Azospirillum lipoferum TaxID=193 RepID=A0A5A9GS85_AZOLI|nr:MULTISPECIES: hypothetical protein [Azospirillum]KAA0597213.1 hypothetical protein FZ942_08970 [Azospirillum lipoferum]MCP1608724.1 hypothetical protein [Azospirillum lipoferum]MDW5535958.1 hypothetical protein [Azospirillum sp. NL1]